jgi:hypothetical protein
MSRKIETYGAIKDGKLHISYRDLFITALSDWKDCRVRVTVERLYRKRSLLQNAYYFSVVIHEFREGYFEMTGEKITAEQAHEILKLKCNGKDITNKDTGEIMIIPGSTAQLTTTQFMEFIEECIKFVGEWFNRRIPEPGEQTDLFEQ